VLGLSGLRASLSGLLRLFFNSNEMIDRLITARRAADLYFDEKEF
jgi:hypothetical protein